MDEERAQKIEQLRKNVNGKKYGWSSYPANPADFIRSIGTLNKRFAKTGQQQDVQEFLRFFLGYLQDYEKEKLINSENAEKSPKGILNSGGNLIIPTEKYQNSSDISSDDLSTQKSSGENPREHNNGKKKKKIE